MKNLLARHPIESAETSNARWKALLRSKYFLPSLLIIASLLLVVYASTSSISISNTSTVQAGQSIALTQPTSTPQTTCPAFGNTAYTTTPTSLAWALTAGGAAQTLYFCQENTGTGTDTAGATASGTGIVSGNCPASASSASLAFNEGGSGVTISAGGVTAAPLSLNVCAGGSVAPGTGPTFTITVT